jgi:hypothetical protein
MLEQELTKLARLNKQLEIAEEAAEKEYLELTETPQFIAHQEAEAHTAEIEELISEVRDRVYELTLHVYQETGEKKPANGVGIRVYQKVQYDEENAFEWCKVHLNTALKIDKRKLEKHLKAIQETAPPEWCEYYEEPKATISSDLSVYEE